MVTDAHLATRDRFAGVTVAAVLDDAQTSGARIYGISGLQGSGKSTLAAQLVAAAAARGLDAVALSLDDVYLDRAQRARLAREVHPLLATRGPPGTHDLALACRTLDALRAGHAVRLPRFDKRSDDRLPSGQWPLQDRRADLVFFEGWCLGVPAQPASALQAPLNALEREDDPDGRWRRWCNAALARDYPGLWRRIDRLLFLQPPDFSIVPEWRWQQERALHGAGTDGMDRARVERFVQHYERVSRQALRALPWRADALLPLDRHRRPGPLLVRTPPAPAS